jgi:hypothetical protein
MGGTLRGSDTALARRLEAAEAANGFALAAAGGGEARRIAGGCALYAGGDSPMTHALGIGMEGAVPAEEFDRLERFFFERGCACLIDLCPLADVSVLEQVMRRGYSVIEFNNLMARRVGPDLPLCPPPAEALLTDDAPHEVWCRTVLEGFAAPGSFDPGVMASMVSFPPMGVSLLAEIGGQPAAGAAMAVRDGVALLAGDATLPWARRRGLQCALIAERLHRAAAAGCDLAMASVVPGSQSHRNYERMGFELVYMRVNLMRQPA